MQRTRKNLLELAGGYAAERRAPINTIVKELLHYEILFALVESGAAERLAFQGGTALRLCYQGNRYSEDLDFAGGASFNRHTMAAFVDLLEAQVSKAYGLEMSVKEKTDSLGGDGIGVGRWQVRIQVPQSNPSLPQRQVINVEVVEVPAHDVDISFVTANYDHLPPQFRSILVPAESLDEILADKIIALGAWPYLKNRDIWDIKFLADKGLSLRNDLVERKIADYRLDPQAWRARLSERITAIESPEAARSFHEEMSRFVDVGMSRALANPQFFAAFQRAVRTIVNTSGIVSHFASNQEKPNH